MINIDHRRSTYKNGVTIRFVSYINIFEESDYEFQLECIGCCALYIEDLEDPLIDKTDCNSLRSKISKLHFTKGLYDLELYYSATVKYYTVKLYWKMDDKGWSIIGPKYFRVKRQPPAYLSYRSNRIIFEVNVQIDETPLYLGFATQFSYDQLEENNTNNVSSRENGISVDVKTGRIYGIIFTSPKDPLHLGITCFGIDGKDYTDIYLLPKVDSNYYIQRLQLEIYLAREEQCSNNITPFISPFEPDVIGINRLVYKTLINNVNYSDILPKTFPGYILPTTLYTSAIEGDIVVEKYGKYVITVIGNGPLIVMVDKYKVFNYECTNYAITLNISLEITTKYVYFKIKHGHFGNILKLEVYWSSEELKIPFTLIPSKNFAFYSDLQFEYSTSVAMYVGGESIDPNIPFITTNNDEKILYYFVYPLLPSGLILDTKTGVISGTPDVIFSDMKNYIVRATTESGIHIRTAIRISIVTIIPPCNIIFLVDNVPVTRINGEIGVELSTIQISARGTIKSISTVPALPEGLEIDFDNHIIKGTPIVDFTGTITFHFGNYGGYSFYNIYLNIETCRRGGFISIHFYYTQGNGKTIVNLIDNNDGKSYITNETITTTYDKSFCLYYSNFTLLLNRVEGNPVTFFVDTYNHTMLTLGDTTKWPITQNFSFHFTSMITLPELSYSYSNNLIVYSYHYNYYQPIIEKDIAWFEMTNCPSTMVIDTVTGVITGLLDEDTVCYVKACNLIGCTVVTVNFTVVLCQLPYRTFTVVLHPVSHSNDIFVTIIEARQRNKILQIKSSGNYEDETYNICLDQSYFYVLLNNKSSDLWVEGSYIEITLNSFTLFSSHASLWDSQYQIITKEYFPNPLLFKYTTTDVKNWYSQDLDDSSWNEMNVSYFLPAINSSNLYLRFNMECDYIFIESLQFHFLFPKTNYEIEIYIRGKLFTIYLASERGEEGEENEKMLKKNNKGKINNNFLIFSSLIKKYFKTGNNVISIHLKQAEPIQWINKYEIYCYLSPSGTTYSTTTSIYSDFSFDALDTMMENMVDGDISTNYLPIINYETLNISFILSFDGWTQASINSYYIRPGFEGREMDPRSWILLGILNHKEYVIDTHIDEVFERNEIKYFLFPEGTEMFSTYKLMIIDYGVVSSNNRSNRIHISEFGLVTQRYEYCENILGFPDTRANTRRVLSCGPGYDGIRIRECDNYCIWGEYPSFADKCKLALPQNLVYLFNTSLLYHLPVEYLGKIYPRVGGAQLRYMIFPELPKGLSFDELTGTISGTPLEESPLPTKYIITAMNELGKTSTSLYIQILRIYCPETVDYPKTDVGEVAMVHCKGQSGFKSRECIYKDHRVQWSAKEDNNCGGSKPIPTSIYIIVIVVACSVAATILVIFMFRVKNRNIDGSDDDEVPSSLQESAFYNRILAKSSIDESLLSDD